MAYHHHYLFSESPYCFCFVGGIQILYCRVALLLVRQKKYSNTIIFAILLALAFLKNVKLFFEFISRECRYHRSSVLNHTSPLWHQFCPI